MGGRSKATCRCAYKARCLLETFAVCPSRGQAVTSVIANVACSCSVKVNVLFDEENLLFVLVFVNIGIGDFILQAYSSLAAAIHRNTQAPELISQVPPGHQKIYNSMDIMVLWSTVKKRRGENDNVTIYFILYRYR